MTTRLPTTAPMMLPVCEAGEATPVALGDSDGTLPTRTVPEVVAEEDDGELLVDIPAASETPVLVAVPEDVAEELVPDPVDAELDVDKRVDVDEVEGNPVPVLEVVLVDVVVEVVVGEGFTAAFCVVVVVAGTTT